MKYVLMVAGIATLAACTGTAMVTDFAPVTALCGTGDNSHICFASLDRAGKLKPKQRAHVAKAAPLAIDAIYSPAFEAELIGFMERMPAQWRANNRYWRGFDPKQAIAQTQRAFAGVHIDTVGGLRARLATTVGNLAYEGSDNPVTGERNILLNRYRVNRHLPYLANTFVHEASHKGGYSHSDNRSPDQRCEPPYVMGQITQKLVDPAGWVAYSKTKDACRFWIN